MVGLPECDGGVEVVVTVQHGGDATLLGILQAIEVDEVGAGDLEKQLRVVGAGLALLLEVGATVRNGVPSYQLSREAISIETPDGKTIPLASNEAFRAANLTGLQKQAEMIRDSINYFPPGATHQCRIGFFADVEDRVRAYDQVELSSDRACVGRLYFPVEGGIQYGQHWLNVKFGKSVLRVPFRILTKDEEKFLDKNYKSIEKQVKEAFQPKKK